MARLVGTSKPSREVLNSLLASIASALLALVVGMNLGVIGSACWLWWRS